MKSFEEGREKKGRKRSSGEERGGAAWQLASQTLKQAEFVS